MWFLAIHLLTQAKTALSALALMPQIGVTYNIAWSLKHKIMQAMDDRKPLTGLIQLDEVYWGGEHSGGKHGRGLENKTPFVAVVALNEDHHPIAMTLDVSVAAKSNAGPASILMPASLVYSLLFCRL